MIGAPAARAHLMRKSLSLVCMLAVDRLMPICAAYSSKEHSES